MILATDRPDLGHALSVFLSERRVDVLDVVDDAGRLLGEMISGLPDAVLVDWHLGEGPSTQAVADLQGHKDHPTPVIILSTGRERRTARATGAAACATLGDPPDTLLAALIEVSGRPV